MKRIALYPGTFDPITNGHLEIISRTVKLFSEVVIGVAKDAGRETYFSFEERVACVQASVSNMPHVTVKGFSGFLVDFYQQEGAQVMVRGMRGIHDFDHEFQLAHINQHLLNEVETIFLLSSKETMFVSASMVREMVRLGGNVQHFVPAPVLDALKQK